MVAPARAETSPTQERDFSDELQEWLESDGDKTVGGLIDTFDERSFAITVMMALFIPALPVPTAGVSHLFELAAVLVAAQMVLGRRRIWLPEWLLRRELGGIITGKAIPFMLRRIRWFERFSEPRMAGLFERTWFLRVLGLVLIGCAVGSAVAPPFSMLDTLPALGGVVICLAVVLADVVVLGIGAALATAGIALIVTLGAAAARFVTGLF